MLEVIFYFAGFAGALWLAVATVDAIVAGIRREWRFSIRSLLIIMAVFSLVLGVLVTLIRK
jgi:hypothetical protein